MRVFLHLLIRDMYVCTVACAGEHATYAKMTNFELGVHIPFIIRAPWKAASVGQHTKALAEAVDLYPTLAELAGLPSPTTQGQALNGTSLVAVFDDPANASGVKDAAFSQFGKTSSLDVHPNFYRNQTQIMGYVLASVRLASMKAFAPVD